MEALTGWVEEVALMSELLEPIVPTRIGDGGTDAGGADEVQELADRGVVGAPEALRAPARVVGGI